MPRKLSFKISRNLSNKLRIYSLILLFSLTIFFVLIFFTSIFQVKDILIEGDTPENQIVGLDNIRNQNLLFLSQIKK